MTSGTYNTLPLEIYGMTTNVTTPVLYALGTVTTAVLVRSSSSSRSAPSSLHQPPAGTRVRLT